MNHNRPIGHTQVMEATSAEAAIEDNEAVRRSVRRPYAFAVLFDHHYDPVWRYLCKRAGSSVADDLAGETFLRAFTKRAAYEPSPLGVRPWLYGIATNLLREETRRNRRQLGAYARAAEPSVDVTIYEEVDGRIDAAILGPAVRQALARLDPADRDTLLLLALTELSYEGIAAATGVPVGTVRSRLNRARRLMRDALDPLPTRGEERLRMIDDTTELEAIRAVLPLDGDPDIERRVKARTDLLHLIQTAQAETKAGGKGRRNTVRRRPWVRAWGIGALTGVAAAVVVAVILVGHGGAVQPTSAVAAILEKAAAKAPAMVSPVQLGPHQYWYEERVYDQQFIDDRRVCKTKDCYQTMVQRIWVGTNDFATQEYFLARSTTALSVTHAPPNVPNKTRYYVDRSGRGGRWYDPILPYNLMLTVQLPTSGSMLLKLVAQHVRFPSRPNPAPHWEEEQYIISSVQGVLSEPRIPARMLSAIYRLLATVPGGRFEGKVTDTLGRPAIKLAFKYPEPPGSHASGQLVLFFNPKTYVLLDTVYRFEGKMVPPYEDIAYVRSGLVHKIGALPNK